VTHVSDPATPEPNPVPTSAPAARRDLGSGGIVLAAVLALLALASPVATTRSTDGTGSATATSGWFGDLVSTDGAGARTVSAGAVPAFGWVVVAGVVLLGVALALRLSAGRSAATAVLAAGWLAATGVLVVLHTAARAARLRDVLTEVVPGQVALTGSAGPWLLVASGALAAVAALAPRRTSRPARVAPPPLAVWQPVVPGSP
jgi:hypothetical protein